MTIDWTASFLIGLFGSLHCLGMCGPLVLAYSMHIKSPDESNRLLNRLPASKGFFHHLAFHLGRLITYGILGALAAGFFHLLGLNFHLPVRGGFILLGGGLIIFLGLSFLQVIPSPALLQVFPVNLQSFSKRLYPTLFKNTRAASKLALGGTCGLLPCCLSLSMLVKAALTENLFQGFITMIAFGLGTLPALMAVGFAASLLTLRTRLIGERLAALSVIAMGLILVVRGVRLLF
jgi:uncharacterized protein